MLMVQPTLKHTQLIRYFTILTAVVIGALSLTVFALLARPAEAAKCADGKDAVDVAGLNPNPQGQSIPSWICEDGSQPQLTPKEQQDLDAAKKVELQQNATSAANSGTCKYISAPFQNIFCLLGGGGISNINTNLTGSNSLISWIVELLIGIMGIAFVITILISAIQIMAGGISPESLSSAKKRLSVAAISLGLLIGLQAILALIGL